MGIQGEYFYRPEYGESGLDAYNEFDEGLLNADTELSACHEHRTNTTRDDHTQYYNSVRHTKAIHDALNINADTLDGYHASDFAPTSKGVTNGDSHDHIGGDGAAITESAISLSDVTINDVSISKHGFCPKLPNDSSKFLCGDGTWTTISGGSGVPSDTVVEETSYGQSPSAGTSTTYSRGDHTHGTPAHTKAIHDALGIDADTVDGYHLNQSLNTTDTPSFVNIKLSSLTDGYVPYHQSDTSGLTDSPIQTDGANVGIGRSPSSFRLTVSKSDANIMSILREGSVSGQGAGINFMAFNANNDAVSYAGIAGIIDTNTVGSQSGYLRLYVTNSGTLYDVLECQKTGLLKVYAVSGNPTISLHSRESGYGYLQIRYKYEATKHRIGFTDGSGNWLLYSEYGTNNLCVYGQVLAPTGSQTAPSFTFSSDSTTGLYHKSGAYGLDVAVQSQTVVEFLTTGLFPADSNKVLGSSSYAWKEGWIGDFRCNSIILSTTAGDSDPKTRIYKISNTNRLDITVNFYRSGQSWVKDSNDYPGIVVNYIAQDNPEIWWRLSPIGEPLTTEMQLTSTGLGIKCIIPETALDVANLFQVNTSGNLVKIRGVSYSWPSSQGGANTYLKNDGSGNLTWAAGTGGGASTFLELTDTPSSYSGQASKYVRVKSDETGLEFVTVSGGATTFLQLTDTPSSYSGQANKFVRVKSDETGLEFVTGGGGTPGGSNTQVQFNDNGVFGGDSAFTWDKTYKYLSLTGNGTSYASLEIAKTASFTGDRQGAIHSVVTKSGGSSGLSAMWNELRQGDTALTSGFDIAMTNIVVGKTVNGGSIITEWIVAATPWTNTGNWAVGGMEVNPYNRYADAGKQYSPGAKWTFGIAIVPEYYINLGDGTYYGYNVTYGILFQQSGLGNVRTHIPLYFAQDSIAYNGTGICMRGGSSASNRPDWAMEFRDYFDKGIDFANAILYGAAIRLPNDKKIVSRNYQNSADIPLIGTDTSNNVSIGEYTPANIIIGYGATLSNPVQIWVNGTNKVIEAGPPDSGGSGYRVLRVAN